MINDIILYLESNQPIATIVTGMLAIFAVLVSQISLYFLQKSDHNHQIGLKNIEITLKKKEELIDHINIQIKDITKVEDIFDLWESNFEANYMPSQMSQVLRDIDNRVNKIHIIIQLYFEEYIPYINKIRREAQEFHEICAAHFMAAKFGSEDYYKTDPMNIVEICNSYAVSYMHLSSHFIEPKLITKYPLK
ncbi:hypothetical protein [Shewanella surugensis]|uniref:LemA family protein n=1 Tax=Shewanella surugensis TaxID=212020 RepID=A0ABT0LIF2_9GAMM|nr:hypothetical protein [Shewanella surugensis]MCL1127487.1 hypothetical protein [Shewanella surugensis]